MRGKFFGGFTDETGDCFPAPRFFTLKVLPRSIPLYRIAFSKHGFEKAMRGKLLFSPHPLALANALRGLCPRAPTKGEKFFEKNFSPLESPFKKLSCARSLGRLNGKALCRSKQSKYYPQSGYHNCILYIVHCILHSPFFPAPDQFRIKPFFCYKLRMCSLFNYMPRLHYKYTIRLSYR